MHCSLHGATKLGNSINFYLYHIKDHLTFNLKFVIQYFINQGSGNSHKVPGDAIYPLPRFYRGQITLTGIKNKPATELK